MTGSEILPALWWGSPPITSTAGVRVRADRLGVPFHHLSKEKRTPQGYRELVEETNADSSPIGVAAAGDGPQSLHHLQYPPRAATGIWRRRHARPPCARSGARRVPSGRNHQLGGDHAFRQRAIRRWPVFFRYPVPSSRMIRRKHSANECERGRALLAVPNHHLVLTRKVHWNGETESRSSSTCSDLRATAIPKI